MAGDFDFDDRSDAPRSRRTSRELDSPRPGYGSRPPKSGPAPILIVALAGGGLLFLAVIVIAVLVVRKATRDTTPPDSGGTTVTQTTIPRPGTSLPVKTDPDPIAGTPTKAVVEKVKKATVRIRVLFNNGTGGSGSGFVEKDSRLVLTNAHVVGLLDKKERGPRAIELVVNSGEGPAEYTLGGELVAVDKESDLALIRPFLLEVGARHIVPEGLTVPKSPNVSLLQRLFVFGYPFGERLGTEITVSETSVSSLRRDPATGKLAIVQVKGGMNPGNSGGPVVDSRGNVVGVAVAGIQGTDINFAIPGEVVQQFIARKRK